jgi:xylulokinase
VELRDTQSGALLARGRRPHPPTFPPVSEQNPADWWAAFCGALHDALTAAGLPPSTVDAISVGAQCHGLVAMDAQGIVLRPVKLWNDTTSAPQAAAMVERKGTEWWVRTVGSAPTAAFTITKLAWLAEHEPHLLRRLGAVCVPHDWLTFKLSGRRVTDRSDASGTGFYSVDGQWLTDLLAEVVSPDLDWRKMIPYVLGPSEPAGTLQAVVADELGLRRDVLVGAGGGDQHLGAVGMGMAVGEVLYSLGTSGVVITTSDGPVVDLSGMVNSVSDATGRFLPLVCTLNCTKVTDTFTRLLGVDHEQLAALALSAPMDHTRPVLAAYFDGERSPNRPNARGMLANLTNETTREQLALAAFEGVLLGLLAGQEAIRAAGAPVDGRVIVAGGGAKSPAYRQILADLLGAPVQLLDVPEATARGACVQATAVLDGCDVRHVRDAWHPPVLSTTSPRQGPVQNVAGRYTTLAELADVAQKS